MLTSKEIKDVCAEAGYTMLECPLDEKTRADHLLSLVKRNRKYCVLLKGTEDGTYLRKEKDILGVFLMSAILCWNSESLTISATTTAARIRQVISDDSRLCNICLENPSEKGCPSCTFNYCLQCREGCMQEQLMKTGVFLCGICRHPLMKLVH